MNFIYDLIVVLVFAGFLASGYRKGLLRTLLELASTLISIVIAYILVKPFTSWLSGRDFLKGATDSISSNVGEQTIFVGDQLISPLTNFMPEKWARNIVLQSDSAQESLSTQVAEATARLFLGAVAFLILFLTLRAVFVGLVRMVTRILDHIPLLGWVNHLGGLLLGAVFGIIVIVLITMILTALAVNSETLHSVLSSSMILDFLSDKDIFTSLLDTII